MTFAIVDVAFIMDELQSTAASDNFGNFITEMPSSNRDMDDTNYSDNDVDADAPSNSQEEIELYLKENRNPRTVSKTKNDVQKFQNFIFVNYGESEKVEDMPAEKLDKILCKWIIDFKKKNGSEYEPDTVTSYRNSIDRHIRQHKMSNAEHYISLTQDPIFSKHVEVLNAKRKNLKCMGKGLKPNRRNLLTAKDQTALVENGVFSHDRLDTLNNLVWYNNSMHFGMRAFREQYDLRWGDVKLHEDAKGEYLEYLERKRKTRQGDITNSKWARKVAPRAYATSTPTCPVQAYKIFKKHRLVY